MVASIRRFLLVNLLISVAITTIVTTTMTLYLDRKDIEKHLDPQLAQITLALQAILPPKADETNAQILQKQINQIPTRLTEFTSLLAIENPSEPKQISFQFQVWDDHGNLILHSKHAPNLPLSSGQIGPSTQSINQEQWRLFTYYNQDTGYTIVIAQRYAIWNELARRIARDDILIAAIIYPLLGLLIWFIVGKGLKPLKRITSEITHREPGYLEPVSTESVPQEIQPLIKELNNLFERLKAAFEREKRFTADAAHELKTPLAVLKTQAQLALKAKDDHERITSLQRLIQGVDRGNHVVQQLLTLHQMQPNLDDHSLSSIDLRQIAIEVIADLVPIALEKKIEIELLAKEQAHIIKGLEIAISILIRNLIDNAIRYTPQHGQVKVKLAQQQNTILLQVMDNGPGIPEELRDRVFARFFRILGTKISGSGLGLAIVQQIVELHRATIRLEDAPFATGLQVSIEFPSPPVTDL